MTPHQWRGVTILAVVSATALVLSTAIIVLLLKDPVWVARTLLRWL